MNYIYRKIAPTIGIVAAGCLLALSTTAANALTTAARTCQLNLATAKMKVLALSGVTVNFGTLAFQDLLDTSTAITKTATGCIVVQFSGDVETSPDRAIYVRAVIATPLTLSVPQFVTFVGREDSGIDEVSNAATFVFAATPAGTYTIKIQWHGSAAGLPVTFGNRTLIVYYQ